MTSVVRATSIEDWGIQPSIIPVLLVFCMTGLRLKCHVSYTPPGVSVDSSALDHGTAFCSLIVTHKLPFTAEVFYCILGGVFVAIYRFGGFQSSSSAQTGWESRLSLNRCSEENIKWLWLYAILKACSTFEETVVVSDINNFVVCRCSISIVFHFARPDIFV